MYKLLIAFNKIDQSYKTIDVDEEVAPDNLYLWGWDHFTQCPIFAPLGTPQPEDKFDSNQNHRRKVLFESKLAIAVLSNYSLFLPLLHKIGAVMADHLEKKVIQFADDGRRARVANLLSKYFYPDTYHFGRLGDPLKTIPRPASLFRIAKRVLTEARHIEHILTGYLAIYKLFLKLDTQCDDENKRLVTLIHDHETKLVTKQLFANRGRYESRTPACMTTMAGIVAKEDALRFQLPPHTRAIDRFKRDIRHQTHFVTDAQMREIPFVAGPSGHTAAYLCITQAMMETASSPLTSEELHLLTLAVAGVLIAAGSHSFHEIYSVAAQAGVCYRVGNYPDSIPDMFRQTASYQNLLQEFPDIIRDARPAQQLGERALNISQTAGASQVTPHSAEYAELNSAESIPPASSSSFTFFRQHRKRKLETAGPETRRSTLKSGREQDASSLDTAKISDNSQTVLHNPDMRQHTPY
ncbi:hypothetical protein AQUSIP_13800 [Aquicella siphonis]|uniref:Uncharacterized protein n=1 Tax=Aquicella siphonis TaxID=254247 RepID=A0A5E4PIF1_9COXI|nr:hypothetical protein [Aquicella siphonis]VVC76076.1 hypothetical protein AQUSIP_13800 [Aquicella siphonis]